VCDTAIARAIVVVVVARARVCRRSTSARSSAPRPLK
jgi:hypothetical protein